MRRKQSIYSNIDQRLRNPRRQVHEVIDWIRYCPLGTILSSVLGQQLAADELADSDFILKILTDLQNPWRIAEAYLIAIKLLIFWTENSIVTANPDNLILDEVQKSIRAQKSWPHTNDITHNLLLGEEERDAQLPNHWIERLIELDLVTEEQSGYQLTNDGELIGETQTQELGGPWITPWGEAGFQISMAAHALLSALENPNLSLDPLHKTRIENGITFYHWIGEEYILNCAWAYSCIYARQVAEANNVPLEEDALTTISQDGFKKFLLRWGDLVFCRFPISDVATTEFIIS